MPELAQAKKYFGVTTRLQKHLDTRMLARREKLTVAQELSELLILLKNNNKECNTLGSHQTNSQNHVEFGIAFQTATDCTSTQVQTSCIKNGVPGLGSEPLGLSGPSNFPSTWAAHGFQQLPFHLQRGLT